MPKPDAHLYSVPHAKVKSAPATNNAFSSALSSLIAAGSESPMRTSTTNPRKRPLEKTSLLGPSNKDAKKRAAADVLVHERATGLKESSKGEPIDDAAWKRAKRKMDDKARLYAALKRGDVEDKSERYGVDFDRKWAEGDIAGEANDSDEDGGESDNEEMVEFTDEFGRTRRGTRSDALREQRRQQRSLNASASLMDDSARPSMPSNIIYGDTVQAAAFNPDVDVAQQMADLAAKRDRELTPPEAVHYDAESEIRTRGTGFYAFSKEEDERKRQMEDLETLRKQTENERGEKEASKLDEREKRRREIDERRRLIREKKGRAQADRFLDGLSSELSTNKLKGADT